MDNIADNTKAQTQTIQNNQGPTPLNTAAQDIASTEPTLTKPTEKMGKLREKFNSLYQRVDIKLAKLIADAKLRKIAIWAMLGLVVFFVIILVLGILVSITRPRGDSGYFLQKPNITQPSPAAEKQATTLQLELNELKNKVNQLRFPPSELTAPTLEVDIKIE